MKRKNSDSTHYKYDMYDKRSSKRFRSRPATRRPRTYTQMRTEHYIRPRTWAEYGRQAVGTTAAATLGWISANVPGAMVAGRKTYEYLAPNLEVKKEFAEKKAMATYGGAFNTKKDLSAATRLSEDYAKTGVILNREVYGLVSDSDCVYVGHSSYDPSFYAYGIACAIVRKVLRKAGYNATSITEPLPFETNVSSGPGKILFCYTYVNTDGTVGNAGAYELVVDATIDKIVNGSNLAGTIYNFFTQQTGTTVTAPFIIENVYLRTFTDKDASAGLLLASLNMKNEKLNVFMYSRLVLQNRTLNAVSGTSNTDDSSAQPLTGKRYVFSSAVPQTKQKGVLLEGTYNQGLILMRPSNYVGAVAVNNWKEPPLAKMFNNSISCGNVTLQPGQMKDGLLSYSYSGYFNNLWKKFASRNNALGAGPIRYASGKCEMFALEEMMQTAAATKVLVAYQKEARYCFDLKTGPAPLCAMNYASLELNNLQE